MKNTFLTKDGYDILDCETVYYVDERDIHTLDLTKAKTRTNMFCGILSINGISDFHNSDEDRVFCNYLQGLIKDIDGKYFASQNFSNKKIIIKQANCFYCKKENGIEKFNKLQKDFKSKHLKVSDLIIYLKSQNPEELVEFLNYDMEYGEYYRYVELKDFKNEIKFTSKIK